METGWKSPDIIIGSAATGSYYYHRTETEQEIWAELDKGNYVLLAAPRRVGKTSIMKYLASQGKEGYLMVFHNVQGINSEIELYKTLYGLVLNCLSKTTRLKKWFTNYLKTKTITEIDINGGFKIETAQINYLEEFNRLINDLNTKDAETIILLIDEIPELLHRLNKNGKKEEASSIIKNLRQWRQNQNFNKLRLVLAGSIGIHYVVNAIECRTADLNDLNIITCPPLNHNETSDYIEWATERATVKYDEDLKNHLFGKVHYFVPYFMNLMLHEIDGIARKVNSAAITKQTIDDAFDAVLHKNQHFADWKKRLSDYLPKADFNFVNEILTHIAHNDSITIQVIYDKAVKHDKTSDYMDFIDNLVRDGYIAEIEKSYQFLSPFLKSFWKNNNPVYHE